MNFWIKIINLTCAKLTIITLSALEDSPKLKLKTTEENWLSKLKKLSNRTLLISLNLYRLWAKINKQQKIFKYDIILSLSLN